MDNNVEIFSFTGLWNRQTFCNETEKKIKADPNKHYVVLRWDIDQFAMFNDTYGSGAGDQVLKSVANLQKARFDEMKGVVSIGHYNADHFVMCYIKDEADPEIIMEDIISDLNISFPNYYFTIHMGLCEVDESLDVGLCCDRALLAIRKAKNSYNVKYSWYTQEMRDKAILENNIYHAMNDALANREFVPFFQPQYDYSTGDITGAEVLVRWIRPNEGVVSPGVFIPVFEKNGFIYELDKYVCEEACRLYRTWLDKGYNLPSISVNISRYDTSRADFLRTLISIVEKYSLPVERVHIEITESAYEDNPEKFIETITRLRARGFIVEMDDFGSGYSSLNALKDLPISTVKLDLGFLDNTTEENYRRGGNIISSVVRMAHYLGLHVIAEGVETKVQAEYLKGIGCTNMQGYLFARPMPVADFENLIKKQNKQTVLETLNTGIEDVADFLDASVQNTLLFNSFLGGAAIVEYDGITASYLRVNDKFFEVLGVSRSVFDEKRYTLLDGLDARSKVAYLDMLETAYHSGKESECIMCYPTKHDDGKDIWMHSRARFLTKKFDKLLFYVSSDNITERIKLEKENAKLTDELQSIIDNIPGGIAIFRVKGDEFKCEFVSGGFYIQRGYSEVDFNRDTFDITQAVHPDDKERVKNKIFDAVNSATSFYDVYRVLTKYNSDIWVEARSKFVGEPNDGLLYLYSNDITSIIELREQGEYDKEELQNLMNSLTGGVATFVVKDDKFVTEYVTEGAYAITGYTAEEFKEILGDDISKVIFSGDLPVMYNKTLECAKNGGEVEFIARIVRKDKKIVWVKMHGRRVMRGGKIYMHYVYQNLTDITSIYEQIINMSDSALLIFDKNTHELLLANNAAAKLAGRKKSDMIGMRCYDFLYGRTEACEDCPIKNMQNGWAYRTTFRDDGKVMFERYCEIKWNGHDAYLSYASDRTDLYKKQEEFENIISHIPGGIGVLLHNANEHKYLYLSETARKLLGYSESEDALATGYPNKYIIPQDYAELVDTARNATTGVDKDVRVIDNAGNVRWVNIESKFWRNSDDYFYEFVVYADVTERKNVEDEIRTRDEEYRASALQSGKMVCRYIIKNKALVVDPQVAKIFDSVEYIENAPEYLVQNGYIKEEFASAWYGLFEGIEMGQKEGQAILQIGGLSGKFKWYKASYITLYDDKKRPERAILSFEDITEKRIDDKYKAIMQGGMFKALRAVYPLIMICNVSKNEFVALDYDEFANQKVKTSGNYDEFILAGLQGIPDKTHRDDFKRVFSRENIINEFKSGKDLVKLEHRQIGADGKTHWMETTVMRVPDAYDDDISCLAMSRSIDDAKKKEEKLSEALQIASGELKLNEAETEIRLSMAQLGKMICRYDIATGMVYVPKAYSERHGTSELFKAPQSIGDISNIIPDKKNQKKYYDLFKAINRGDNSGMVEIRYSPSGCAPFYEKVEFVNIFDDNKNPVRSVISIEDTTSQHIESEKYDQLKQNELIMRIVAEHSKRIVMFYDAHTEKVSAIDKKVAESYGIDTLFNIHDPNGTKLKVADDSKAALHLVYTNIIAGNSGGSKLYVICLDGNQRWFDFCYTALKDGDKFIGTVISLLDITNRHEEEVAFARYTQTTNQRSQDSLVYVEADLTDNTLERFGGTDVSNLKLGGKPGANYEEILNKYLEITFSKDLQPRIAKYFSREHLLALFDDGQREIYDEWHIKYNESGLRWVASEVELITDPYSGHIKSMLTVKNITDEKDAHIDAQRRAQLDGLTGIYNRASTEMLIEKHLAEPDTIPGVLIMIDLDDLKTINDTFGHQEGDKALKLFATTIKRHFRNTDIVGRLGGDEFMAYLPAVKSENAIRASIGTLMQKVNAITVGSDDKKINLSFSAGCTFAEPELDTFNTIFKKADTALYQIKRNGKNNFVFYTPEMQLSSYKFEGHRNTMLKENNSYDQNEVRKLLDAIGKFYTLIMSANLARDEYYHMECTDFLKKISQASGSYKSFMFALTTITKREDRSEINKFQPENLIDAYNNGNTVISATTRQIDELGRYGWNECTAIMYKNDAGEICAFLFGRASEDKEKEEKIVRLQKIMELAVKNSFEYICVLHPDSGKYEIFGNDGDNTHDVPTYDNFNKVTKEICDTHIIPEEREEYYNNAITETVVRQMNLTGGHYKYRYTMFDGKREAEFYWYEPTHTSILMTVKKIK